MSLRNLVYRVLRRGEKVTGTDNVYLAKNGGWFAIAQFLATGSGLIIAILAARLIDKGTYGTYSYMTSWGAIVSVAALSGISSALSAAIARGHDRTLFTVIRARLRWGLLGTAVALAMGCYYLAQGRIDFFVGFLIVGVCFPLASALASWSDYVGGKLRFDLQAKYGVAITLTTAAAFIAVMIFRPSPLSLVLAVSLTPVILHALVLKRVLAKIPPQGGTEEGTVSYGKRLTMLDTLTTLTHHADRLLVFTYLGAHETAIYAFAMAPTEQIKGLLKSVHSLALPKVAARSLSSIKMGFYRKTAVFAAGIGLIALTYILAAPILFRLLFPTYMESVGYSQWLAVSLLGVIAILPASVFTAHKLLREQYLYQCVSSFASLLMLGILIVAYGLPGAVMARIAGRLFSAAYCFALAQQVFNRASQETPPSRTQDSEGSATT